MEPQERKALIDQVSSPEEERRREAMERLKESLSGDDLDWLIQPLSDDSWRVRKEAIEGLSRVGPDDTLIGRMVPLMDPSRELTLRNSIVEVLERMGMSAAPLLVTHLGTGQADVRKFLVDILGNIADPSSIPGLLKLLQDPEDNIRAASAEALAAIGDASVSEVLIDAIEDSDEWVIFSILGSLAQLRSHDALPVFFQYLDNQILAKPAIYGIGLMGTVKDGIRLMDRIPSLSRGSVKAAFAAAGDIYRRTAIEGDLESCDELVDLVSRTVDEGMLDFFVGQLAVSEQIEIRQSLLAVLGMIGGRSSLDAVLKLVDDEILRPDVDLALYTIARRDPAHISVMLNHQDPVVRRKAVQILERKDDREFLPDLYRMLLDESGHVRKDAARSVSVLGDSSSVRELLPLLEDEYRDVAQAAAEALISLGGQCPVDVDVLIRPMLEDADPGKRILLLMILAEIGAKDWLDLCLTAAQDEDPTVRTAAVRCLGMSEGPLASRTIVNCLADESPEVRVQAAIALGELRPPEALDPLKAALNDQDPWVRSAVVSAFSVQPGASPGDLSEFLASDDLMMKTSVIDALGTMATGGHEEVLDILKDVYTDGGLEIKRSVCRVLGNIRSSKVLNLLMEAVRDKDPGVRTFAVQALAERKEPEAVKILTETAESDTDKLVRETARTLLEMRH